MKQQIDIKKFFSWLPLILVLLLGLVPLIWFYNRGDVLINGVDTNFPLEPRIWFERRLYVWSSVLNAGADFSSSIAGIFFHFLQVIPYTLGINLQTIEIITFIFWFSLTGLSAYWLARVIFAGQPIIQLLFVSFYTLNIYLFNTWENVKVANLSLIAAIPLTLGILFLLKNKKISWTRAGLYSVGAGIILSGAGINPAYFASFFLLILIYGLAVAVADFRRKVIFDNIKNLVFVSVILILVNSFWILPIVNFVSHNIDASGSIDKIGFTNWIDSLSDNTSISNIMRVQGAWDWYAVDSVTGLPLYIPYALNYFHRVSFLVFSFLVPFLVICSLVFRNKAKEDLYLAFGLMFLTGVFLGVGTRLPTGAVFRWFLDHVPFFTLFRSPWYIFTPLVTLSASALIGLLFFNLYQLADRHLLRFGKILLFLFVTLLIVGNSLYSYPLLTGKIFRPGRLDSFYVQFPDYVFEAQKWLGGRENGRIISYPDDEIENFSWGYRGVDSILQLLANVDVLFSPLNAPDSPIARLVKEMYFYLKKGNITSAESLAAKLNAGLIFEKKDQESLSPELPPEIKDDLLGSFGQWNFYKFPHQDYLPRLYATDKLLFGYPYNLSYQFLDFLGRQDLLVSPDDTIVKAIPGVNEFAGRIILARNSQRNEMSHFSESPSQLENRLSLRDMSRVYFDFDIPETGEYQPVLENERLGDFGIDLASTKKLDLEFDGEQASWEVERISDSYLYFNPLQLAKGSHRISLVLNNKNLIYNGDFEQNYSGFKKVGEGSFEIVNNGQGSYLRILNKGKAAPEPSVDFAVPSFDPLSTYVVQFRYRQIYGNNATVIVYQNIQNTLVKAQTERLPNYPEWNTFSFYYEPVKTHSEMRVSLLSPFITDPLGTKVFYDNLEVYEVFKHKLMLVKNGTGMDFPLPTVNFQKISPSEYQGEVNGGSRPHIFVFSENYSPEWVIKIMTTEGFEVPAKPQHFSANFYANAWYLGDLPNSYKFQIYYKPQRLFALGSLISVLTILVILFAFFRSRKQIK